MKPYVYISTGESLDVQRNAPSGARVAIHFPDIGKSVELQADGEGRYALSERPAPGHGGPSKTVATGTLTNDN